MIIDFITKNVHEHISAGTGGIALWMLNHSWVQSIGVSVIVWMITKTLSHAWDKWILRK